MDEMSPIAKAILGGAHAAHSPSDEELRRLERRLVLEDRQPSASLLAEFAASLDDDERATSPVWKGRIVGLLALAAALLLGTLAVGSALLGAARQGVMARSLALMTAVSEESRAQVPSASFATPVQVSNGGVPDRSEVQSPDGLDPERPMDGDVDGDAQAGDDNDPDMTPPAAAETSGDRPLAAKPTERPPRETASASKNPPAGQAVTPEAKAKPATKPATEDDLALQAALVGQTRKTLAQGEWFEVRRHVVDYQERFPGGIFVEEVQVMRMIADCEVDPETYEGVAMRYLKGHPRSIFADRLRASCGGARK